MKRFIVFTFLSLFLSGMVISQGTPEGNVPAIVKKNFKRKNARAQEVKWKKEGDYYIASFISQKGLKGKSTLTDEGKWIKSENEIDMKKVHSGIDRFLSQKDYKSFKIRNITYVQTNTREKYYSVFCYEKKDRKMDSPPITEIQFTTAGKHLTTYDAEVEDDYVEEVKVNKKEKRKLDRDAELISEEVVDEKVKEKDLPSPAFDYLKENYDHEWQTKECRIQSTPQMGTVYYVVTKKQGYSESYEHYFDYNGYLIKRRRLDIDLED